MYFVFQQYILALNAKLDELTGLPVQECEAPAKPTSSEDFVEKYLCNFFREDINSSSGSTSSDNFLSEVMKLETRPKIAITASSEDYGFNRESVPSSSGSGNIPDKFDIIRYWKQRKFTNPGMYRIAVTLLSIPSTQVTVERLFSQLKLLITDSRTRLNGKNIKALMLLKANESLLAKVIDELDAELN